MNSFPAIPLHVGSIAIRKPWWLMAVLPGVLIALCVYVLLPGLGFPIFRKLFSLQSLFLGTALLVGTLAYAIYLRWMGRRLHLWVYFIAALWPILEFFNQYLLFQVGINLHLRPWLFLLMAIPILQYGIPYTKTLYHRVPYAKYYLAFLLIIFFYFLFYNARAVNPPWVHQNRWSDGAIGAIHLVAYFHCFLGILVAGVAMLQHPHPSRLFDRINKTLLWVTLIASLCTMIGYPFGVFRMHLDGFYRAIGIFTHPNPFAHHMGIVLLYFLGLFCYYQGPYKNRMPGWLLTGGILIGLSAFLLGLSKTAIGVFLLCASLLFLINLSSPWVRKTFFRILLCLAVLVPLGLWCYQLITEQSFFDILEARINQKESYIWRLNTWNYLLSHIEGIWVLIGHGFTAANAWVFQMGYNDRTNAQPLMMIHNGYLSLLYDIGVLGGLIFLAAVSLIWNALRLLWQSSQRLNRPLLGAVVAMGVYFLIVCGFDEMTYMFDAPLLFWTLSTLIYSFSLQETQPCR